MTPHLSPRHTPRDTLRMKRIALLLPVLAALLAPAHAKFLMPDLVPVERLVKSGESYVAQHPKDASAHYTLGRIRYLAFILQIEMVPTSRNAADGRPSPVSDKLIGQPLTAARRQQAQELARAELGLTAGFPEEEENRKRFFQAVSRHEGKLRDENWRPPAPPPAALVAHAEKAAVSFRKAKELNPKDGLYALGLASLLEQFADWNDGAKIADLPPALAGHLPAAARSEYLLAWTLAAPDDARAKNIPLGGLGDLVSYEAGRAFLRLAETGNGALPEAEKAAVKRVKPAIDKLEKLPPGPVTPLVLALRPHASLSELLAPRKTVEFDLRGFGGRERWPWLKPEAGLLVWDPLDQRTVTSGRQLFGNYTFRIFWRTGYDALRTLDDDGNGQLTGFELLGLSVWFDRNGDGCSARDEVTSVFDLGICALAVEPTACDGPHPTNSLGVTLRDGRQFPTWDWIVEPLAPH